MKIYMKSNLVYVFNRQKIFKLGYIAKNTRSSQEHKRYYENNMDEKSLLLAKGK